MKKPRADRKLINEFISLKKLAFVGVSSNPKGFGFVVWKELRKKGWDLIPVNPKLSVVDGMTCYPNLNSLPEVPEGVISMVPAAVTASVAREAYDLGIRYLWVQQKSESDEAIRFCQVNKMKAVFGECILMHHPPVKSIHAVHRWLKYLFR